MNNAKSFQIQRQIMENSRSVNEYYKDFEQWVEDMNKKDKIVSKIKSSEPQPEPLIVNNEQTSSSFDDIEKKKNDPKFKKFRRDGNSIKDYYDNWDKVDADEDLIDVDSGIVINSSDTAQSLYNEKKKSNPNQNLAVNIVNNRNALYGPNWQIEKLKKEANGHFALRNFTKSIELYTSAIKLLKDDDRSILALNLYNNRGNCQIKLNNYKIGIKDFDFVLDIDKNNMKALYRRGICYEGIEKYNLAFRDLNDALTLAQSDNEKDMIKTEIDKVISCINVLIAKERKKMENFNYNDNIKFKKMNIIDLPKDSVIGDDEEIVNKNNNSNVSSNSIKEDKKTSIIREKVTQNKNILKKEEIAKFVYDITTEKLSSSSFKYAYRNFGNDIQAKKDYLLKIDPLYLQKIFKTDLDKDTLLDIIKCLKLVENDFQIKDYLRGIMKINRIKLIVQLLPKKTKQELIELFDKLEKGSDNSDVMPIKDFFLN